MRFVFTFRRLGRRCTELCINVLQNAGEDHGINFLELLAGAVAYSTGQGDEKEGWVGLEFVASTREEDEKPVSRQAHRHAAYGLARLIDMRLRA